MGEPTPRPRRGRTAALAAALLAAHAALVGWAVRDNFVVVDEAGFLASGVAHLETGTFFAYRVNPPLPRMLAAVPMLAAGAAADHANLRDAPGHRCESQLGRDFAAANGDRYLGLVALARLTGLGWSLVGGWVVFAWARDASGDRGGLLALALWCFNPAVVGLAAVVIPDVAAAAAGLAATYAFRNYLHNPSWGRALAAGLLLGVAELTKFTLLVLYPAWLVAWVVARWLAGPTALRQCPLARAAAHAGVAALVSLYVVNTGYGFAGTFTPLGEYPFVSRMFGGVGAGGDPDVGNRFGGTAAAGVPVPLPAAYVRGIDTQRKDFEAGWRSYLRGEWRDHGWWYYYLYALAVKLPVGALVLAAAGAALAAAALARRADRVEAAVVLLPAALVLGFVSSQTGFNHHMRYVLPAMPFLFVAAGRAAAVGSAGGRAAAWGLAGWAAASSLAVAPHFLSYFNEPAGGPDNGHAHLADSNIDWGQDLLHLKRWAAEHPADGPLYLAYFNALDASTAGLAYEFPPDDYPPGRYAVSAHYVVGGTFPAFDGRGRVVDVPYGRFTPFRQLTPVAKAGYGIWVYDVTPADAERLRAARGPAPPGEGRP